MRKIFNFLFSFIACILFSVVYADNKFLTADNAFSVSGEIVSPTEFTLNWQIAPNYHLYSDSITVKVISPSNVKLEPFALPQGTKGDDPSRGGPYMEYHNKLQIPVQLAKGTTTGLDLEVGYQGCADVGLCYPPQTKKITLSEVSDDKLGDIIQSSNDIHSIDHLLQNQKPWAVLLSFFVFGLLLAFTPCVFPMLPILSSIIAGQGEHITSLRAFTLSLVYVLASAITYAVAGVIAGLAGHHLQSALQNEWVIGFSGILFIILAMSLFGFYELQLPHRLQSKLTHLSHQEKPGTLIGVAIMGIFSTLIVSPCVSAPLVGALAYIGESGSPVFGGLALFVMGFAMGVPLLIIGTSAGKLMPKAGHWMGAIKNLFGIVLIGMAIWLWSRILPGAIILGLWGILAITCAIYLGALETTTKGWPRFWKAIGIAAGVYGLCLLVGAASGSENVFEPLDRLAASSFTSNNNKPVEVASPFKRINDAKELAFALKQGQPVLLDFYADWCVACQEMERKVFNDAQVAQALKQANLQLLQVDLTKSTPETDALLKQYKVLAPPTIVFFNKKGNWITNANVVGEQSLESFLAQLIKINFN